MKPYPIAAFLAVILGVTGCDPSTPSADIIATVGDQVLTVAEFAEAAQRRQIANNDDAKRALLDELLEDMRLLQYAHDNAFDKDPEFQREMDKWLISRARFAITDSDTPPVTEGEVQAAYNSRQTEFTTPDRFRLAMIYVSKDTKEPAKKAEDIRQQAAAGTPFSELAASHSEDRATRYRGGDLGFSTARSLDPAWGATAPVALVELQEIGELSPVIDADDGYRIFKLLERQPGSVKSFADARQQLTTDLTRLRQKTQRQVSLEAATEGISVAVHEETLAAIHLLSGNHTNLTATPPPSPAD